MAADGSVVILIEGDDSDLKGKLDGIGGIASDAASAAKTAIAGIGIALAAAETAVVAFAKTSVDAGMQFDSAMSQVAATMGLTVQDIQGNVDGAGDTFAMLRDKALEMGSETKFTAQEAAEGLNILAMSGYGATEAVGMIEDVLHLAAAGSMNMASAAGFVSGAMKGFADTTKDAQYYADLMAKGATLANTDVSQLGEALSGGAAAAKSYGQSAETATLALLRLAEQGEVGSAASTALAAAMKNLYAPTDQAAKLLQELGVQAFDPATGSARDFNEVVNELDAALSGFTDQQKTAYAQTIFGIQGFDAYNKMVVTSVEKQEEWAEALRDSAGEAARQYDTMTDNLVGDIDKWNSAVDGFKIALSDELMPTLREFTQSGTDAVSHLTETFKSEGLGAAIEEIGGMAASALTALASSAPAFIDTAVGLIQSFLSGIRDNLPEIASAALDIVGSLAGGIVEILPELAQTGTEIILQLAQSIIDGLPSMVPAAVQTLATLVEQLTGNLDQIIEAGIQVIVALGEGLIEALPDLFEKVPEIVSNIANVINDNAPKLLAAAAKLIVELGVGLIQNIPVLIKNIPKIIQAIVDAWSAFNWLDLGSKAITAIKDGILKLIPAVKTAGKNVLDAVVNAVKSLPQTLKTLGQNGVTGLANAMRNLAGNAANAMKSIASSIWGAIKGLPSQMLDIGGNIVKGIANGIKNGAAAAINAVADLASGVVDAAKNFFGIHSPSRVMAKEVGPYLPQGVAAGVKEEVPRTERTIAQQMADLTNRVRAAVEAETANISVGITARANEPDAQGPATNGGNVINVYVGSGTLENTEKARNLGRELGAEAARELRRRGSVPT